LSTRGTSLYVKYRAFGELQNFSSQALFGRPATSCTSLFCSISSFQAMCLWCVHSFFVSAVVKVPPAYGMNRIVFAKHRFPCTYSISKSVRRCL